jgi:hypothetical protein
MKDKLTVEDFKKIFDNFKVEGFSLHESGLNTFRMNTPEKGIIINTCSIWDYVYYPLVLTRIFEGINKKQDYFIDLDYYNGEWILRAFEGCSPEEVDFLDSSADISIDQAKTQAIKYILKELK